MLAQLLFSEEGIGAPKSDQTLGNPGEQSSLNPMYEVEIFLTEGFSQQMGKNDSMIQAFGIDDPQIPEKVRIHFTFGDVTSQK